ncbi:hypothetical protein BBAL3_984 [Brevundimonas sp. BAL3]|nr:hypothetical protein BBAL3_984 [Brevundimonas sp. BAL3]
MSRRARGVKGKRRLEPGDPTRRSLLVLGRVWGKPLKDQ